METILERSEKYTALPGRPVIDKTIRALQNNGMKVLFAETGEEAREKLLSLIPLNAEVMTMTSVTLDTIGVTEEINASGRYIPLRNQLSAMDTEAGVQEMRRRAGAPAWAVGSVHAITEDGQVLIASASGSQLPAYSYGGIRVVWVAGAQKIVRNIDEAMNRIIEHVFPLENKRALEAYGSPSGVNKVLVFNREAATDRITVIIVNGKIGY